MSELQAKWLKNEERKRKRDYDDAAPVTTNPLSSDTTRRSQKQWKPRARRKGNSHLHQRDLPNDRGKKSRMILRLEGCAIQHGRGKVAPGEKSGEQIVRHGWTL